jgi:putative ABC transport system ATP-binding protein
VPQPTQPIEFAAQLHDISVVYGSGAAAVSAVQGISLDVRPKEVLLLMGPSGSGKSTLLQVLGCIRRPTSGSVCINGEAIDRLTQDKLSTIRRARIGFVFQNYNLIPTLRAWENVALALELQGISGSALERESRRKLSGLGLGQRSDAFPQELSGGEKQRVAIARAVVGDPDLILADEPTAALDAASGAQVATLLASIAHEQGRAVVVVTHDARINGIADRIAFLEDGKIRSMRKNIQMQRRSLQENAFHEMDNDDRAGSGDDADRSVAAAR